MELPDIDARARVDAVLDVERRSIFTTVVIVIIGFLFTFARAPGLASPPIFRIALATIAALAVVRFVFVALARRLPPGSAARRRAMFGPLLALVAAWGLFAAWGAVAANGTTAGTLIIATQCLCSAAVITSYGAVPRLAIAIIILTIAPGAVGVIALGAVEHITGLGALLFCAMLVSYVPRVARERHAAVASMLLLEERARSLEHARDAAVAAAAAKEAFFANMSHEIRTPLHGLLGTVERLKTTALDDTQRAAVEALHRCGRMLLGTLNEALDSAQLESGELTLHQERLALRDLLRDVVDLFADQAARKGLALQLDMDVVEHALGDTTRLRQVLQNLVANGVKFTDAGHVTVRARTEVDGHVVTLDVEVSDSGVGFAPRDSARLFQRFSQLTPGRSSGSGLGLSIAAELVRLMGGTIDAASAGAGCGATFRVRVPLRAHTGLAPAIGGRRVLVVDDNPVNLVVAAGYLEAIGVVVEAVSGGREALERAATTRYDAILMDCHMPDIDGFDTTKALRARGDTTPVLAITASNDGSTGERCRLAGMQGLIEKPASPEMLRDALARLMVPAD